MVGIHRTDHTDHTYHLSEVCMFLVPPRAVTRQTADTTAVPTLSQIRTLALARISGFLQKGFGAVPV